MSLRISGYLVGDIGPMLHNVPVELYEQQARACGSSSKRMLMLSRGSGFLGALQTRGIGRLVFHFQLYGAFWLLLQDRCLRRGTIQADKMDGLRQGTVPCSPLHRKT